MPSKHQEDLQYLVYGQTPSGWNETKKFIPLQEDCMYEISGTPFFSEQFRYKFGKCRLLDYVTGVAD